MVKFYKKVVTVEAIQFTGHNQNEIFDFTGHRNVGGHDGMGNFNLLTLEGYKHVPAGYWVIKGIQGDFYPCHPDVFAAEYEMEAALDDELGKSNAPDTPAIAPEDSTWADAPTGTPETMGHAENFSECPSPDCLASVPPTNVL